MDKKEIKINKKKNKDDLDEVMTLNTRDLKRFLRNKVRVTTTRKQYEHRGKEIKRDLKIKEKKENSKDNENCYKCKAFDM